MNTVGSRNTGPLRVRGWSLEEKLANVGTSLPALLRAKRMSGMRPLAWRNSMCKKAGEKFSREAELRSGGLTLIEWGLLLVHTDPWAAKWIPSASAPPPLPAVPIEINITDADLAEVAALERDPVALAELSRAISSIGQSRPKPIQPAAKTAQPTRELFGMERTIAFFKSQSKRK
jgi:hypothetical protein